MSRRRHGRAYADRDPVMNSASDRVDGERFTAFFEVALARLPIVDALIVRQVMEGKPFSAIAMSNAMTEKSIRRSFAKALTDLENAFEADGLREYLHDDFTRTLAQLHRQGGISTPQRVWCERHEKWCDQEKSERDRCAGCPCKVDRHPIDTGPGRPRRYCDKACKQAAYRRRRSSGDDRAAAEPLSCGVLDDRLSLTRGGK
ncbi:hypothetical protein [Nocardia sp. NPDC051832]|uniref:hypothetical protein n=1 Tax=Nocardia sp. NPDC051832 TaxID=3155673 RepID=UPI003430098D